MKSARRPISDIAVNQVIGPEASIPFSKDPQEFLRQQIGKASSTRPGGMLIGADEVIRQLQQNPEMLRGR